MALPPTENYTMVWIVLLFSQLHKHKTFVSWDTSIYNEMVYEKHVHDVLR